eukprot:7987386-Prorocentrum_lima.AAC.1
MQPAGTLPAGCMCWRDYNRQPAHMVLAGEVLGTAACTTPVHVVLCAGVMAFIAGDHPVGWYRQPITLVEW